MKLQNYSLCISTSLIFTKYAAMHVNILNETIYIPVVGYNQTKSQPQKTCGFNPIHTYM